MFDIVCRRCAPTAFQGGIKVVSIPFELTAGVYRVKTIARHSAGSGALCQRNHDGLKLENKLVPTAEE